MKNGFIPEGKGKKIFTICRVVFDFSIKSLVQDLNSDCRFQNNEEKYEMQEIIDTLKKKKKMNKRRK